MSKNHKDLPSDEAPDSGTRRKEKMKQHPEGIQVVEMTRGRLGKKAALREAERWKEDPRNIYGTRYRVTEATRRMPGEGALTETVGEVMLSPGEEAAVFVEESEGKTPTFEDAMSIVSYLEGKGDEINRALNDLTMLFGSTKNRCVKYVPHVGGWHCEARTKKELPAGWNEEKSQELAELINSKIDKKAMKDSAERKKSTKESPNDERKVAGIDKKNPVAKPTKNKDGDKKRRFSQKPRGVNHAGEKTTEEDRYKATRDDLLARFGKRSAVVKTPEKPVTNTPAEKKDSDMTLNDRLSMAKSMDDLSAIGEELEMLGLVELPRSVNEPFAIPFSDTRNCIEAAEALNKKHAELKEKEA